MAKTFARSIVFLFVKVLIYKEFRCMISIITATYNVQDTIQYALNSLYSQTYKNVEHIIVDGKSNDNTLEIIKETYTDLKRRIISESDNGIYDALNKGIKLAKGDIIGILHADDFYADNSILERVAKIFESKNIDGLYGDLQYVASYNLNKVIRFWKSSVFLPELLKKGWMPPHPTLFLKRSVYERYGLFNTEFTIAADYEFILRIFTKNLNFYYLPQVLVNMRIGGTSNRNLKNLFIKMSEDLKAIKRYKIGGIEVLFRKNFSKIKQFF